MCAQVIAHAGGYCPYNHLITLRSCRTEFADKHSVSCVFHNGMRHSDCILYTTQTADSSDVRRGPAINTRLSLHQIIP